MQDIKLLMQNMVSAFATGDVSNVDSLVAETYLDHQGLGSGAIQGPEGFRQVVAAARSAYTHLAVTIEDLIGLAPLGWRHWRRPCRGHNGRGRSWD